MLEAWEESHGNSLAVIPAVPVEHIGAIKRLVGGYGQCVSERHLFVIEDKVVVYAGGYAVFSGESERRVEGLTEQVGHSGQAVHVELEITIVAGLNLHGDGVGHDWLPFVELFAV